MSARPGPPKHVNLYTIARAARKPNGEPLWPELPEDGGKAIRKALQRTRQVADVVFHHHYETTTPAEREAIERAAREVLGG